MSLFSPVQSYKVDQLTVNIYANRDQMGQAAAHAFASDMRRLISQKNNMRMVFAAAPSQEEFLSYLRMINGLPWQNSIGFHMDEYMGLLPGATQSFGLFLKKRLFDPLPFRQVHYIDAQTKDPVMECDHYASLLLEADIDLVGLGIGENGHIAFNDPPVADFEDPAWVKMVELDDICRQQQVNDGCFSSLDDVPEQAITLTIPALMSGKHLHCIVPGPSKAEAVYNTLNGPLSTDCPASIMRGHPSATLYLDQESSRLL